MLIGRGGGQRGGGEGGQIFCVLGLKLRRQQFLLGKPTSCYPSGVFLEALLLSGRRIAGETRRRRAGLFFHVCRAHLRSAFAKAGRSDDQQSRREARDGEEGRSLGRKWL